jgi:RNA polymerase sigma-70 factor (ECF subfamily)
MSSFPTPPDERRTVELLADLRAADDEAWSELYRRHHDELLFLVRRRLGPRLRLVLESEDVLQSVALEAFRALPRFEHRGEGSLRRFLHALVLNKIRDRADTFGAAKRQGGVPLTDSVMASTPAPARPDEAQGAPLEFFDQSYDRLERCLARLPGQMQTVLVLRKLEGWSSKETAERMEKSDEAVRKLYSRALARLSACMQAAPGEAP